MYSSATNVGSMTRRLDLLQLWHRAPYRCPLAAFEVWIFSSNLLVPADRQG